MTSEEIFMLELYDEYNETLDLFREDCANMKQVLSALDDIGENISELLAPVAVEAEQLVKFCNNARNFEEKRQEQSGEQPK